MAVRALAVAIVLASLLATTSPALADDGTPFHRTTPRAVLAEAHGVLVIGVPAGRAWGIESELRPLPPSGTVLVVRLAVTDATVREAFVRVAYYASSSARTRQLSITDSAPVAHGERALVAVELDPPPAAVAYRVRVLARLAEPAGRSSDDAVTAVLHVESGAARRGGSLYSRLLP